MALSTSSSCVPCSAIGMVDCSADNVLTGSKQEQLETVRGHIRDFKAANALDKVIVLWTANTERFAAVEEGSNDTADNLLAAIKVRLLHATPVYMACVPSLCQRPCKRSAFLRALMLTAYGLLLVSHRTVRRRSPPRRCSPWPRSWRARPTSTAPLRTPSCPGSSSSPRDTRYTCNKYHMLTGLHKIVGVNRCGADAQRVACYTHLTSHSMCPSQGVHRR